MDNTTARQEWDKLESDRAPMMSRLERLAQLTIPSVLPPEHYNGNQHQLTNGYNSLGAQAAIHLSNKVMMALFAPSRPFMRLDMDPAAKAAMIAQLGVDDAALTEALATGERAALGELERAGQRQTLFEACNHLVVVGNGLLDLSGDTLNFISIRDYVVRRTAKGTLATLIIKERYQVQELEKEAERQYRAAFPNVKPDAEVDVYTWVRLVGKQYRSTVWLDDIKLSDDHSGKWSADKLPWRVLTWRLPAKQHYGVGRAEDYANDLSEHENLSQALSEGSALASTFRWIASPTGLTRPEDITNSANGAVIPGDINDIKLFFANIGQQLSTVQTIQQNVARRIGQGFLLNSAVTRDAERVTAEEIRIQAMELEASFGGSYSRLAVDMQEPLSWWLLRRAKVEIQGTKIEPKVITGLDALSRNSDRERMLSFLTDVSALDNIQPQTRQRLREANIVSDMAAGNGVERSRYVVSEEEVQARMAQQQEEAMATQAESAAIEAAAQNTINGGRP